MNDPQLPLQLAILAAARVAPAVTAIIGAGPDARFYDRAPSKPTYPMTTFGPMQTVPDYDGCGNVAEVFVQIDCWSMAVGYGEVKALAHALMQALDAGLTVAGFTVQLFEVRSMRTQREGDNLTSRAIINLRYVLRSN